MKRELKLSLFWRVSEVSVCDASSQTYWRIGKVSQKQLAWEPLLETHHRLQQCLRSNVFTANCVVVVLTQSWRQKYLCSS